MSVEIFGLLTISCGLEDLLRFELLFMKRLDGLLKISNLLWRGTYSSFKVMILRFHMNRKWLWNRRVVLLLLCFF
jgi:hypothetical protein